MWPCERTSIKLKPPPAIHSPLKLKPQTPSGRYASVHVICFSLSQNLSPLSHSHSSSPTHTSFHRHALLCPALPCTALLCSTLLYSALPCRFQLELWGELAELACNSLQAGSRVYVAGRIHIDEFTAKDGLRRMVPRVRCRLLPL